MSKMPDKNRIIVEDIRSKNMFNKNCVKQNWYLSYSDGKTEIWDSNMAYTTEFVEVEPNQQYTMSYLEEATIFNIYEYDANKNFIQRQQQNNDKNSFTITTSNNTRFVRLSCGKTRIEKMQFEQGSKTTEYSEYFDFKNKQIHVITGQEFETNETRNGKVVYGKEIDCGKCPASSAKDVETGIDFSKAKLVDYHIVLENNSAYILLFKDIFRINIAKEWGTFQIFCDTDSYSTCDLIVTLYYTKD